MNKKEKKQIKAIKPTKIKERISLQKKIYYNIITKKKNLFGTYKGDRD